MREKLTFVPPKDLIPTATLYAATIKRPDIKIEWQSTDSYEYALDLAPPVLHEEMERALAPLGALLIDRWVCVAPGIGVVETLLGKEVVPWWYVYTYGTMHGGWDQPDELVTRPLCDARAPEEALRLALLEVVRNELDVQALYEAEQDAYLHCEVDVPQ